jgi:hypothetical protein
MRLQGAAQHGRHCFADYAILPKARLFVETDMRFPPSGVKAVDRQISTILSCQFRTHEWQIGTPLYQSISISGE